MLGSKVRAFWHLHKKPSLVASTVLERQSQEEPRGSLASQSSQGYRQSGRQPERQEVDSQEALGEDGGTRSVERDTGKGEDSGHRV